MVDSEQASEQDASPTPDEPQVPIWAFVLIFVGPAVVLTVAAAVAQWWEQLTSSPLTIALLVGHLVSAGGLVLAYVFLYRRRS